MSANSEDGRECPLCLEALELDDVNFFPCTCGYQICRFCWHRIRTNENGLCPACRKQYSEDPANFRPLTAEELQQIKNVKRQKDLQKKQKLTENRKHLANVRVVQRNLVFVVGLPSRLADPEELRKPSYFGKFGKIVKVIVNHTNTYAGTQGPSASAYVTYQRSEDALRAIQAVNNSKLDGRTLKSSLGTTKYCSNFLKKLHCSKQDCMYLHELGDEAASFTKEDMQAGKHQEYERKLHEQLDANIITQNRKQPSPVENIEQFHTEQLPTPPKKNNPVTCAGTEPSQVLFSDSPVLQNVLELDSKSHVTNEDLEIHSEEWHHNISYPTTTEPQEAHSNVEHLNQGFSNSNLAQWQAAVSKLPANTCNSDLLNMYSSQNMSPGADASRLKYDLPQSVTEQNKPQSIFLENTSGASTISPSEQFGAQNPGVTQGCVVNGFSHSPKQQQQQNIPQAPQSWINLRDKDLCLAQLPSNMFGRSSSHLLSLMPTNSEKMNSSIAAQSFPTSRSNIYPLGQQHSSSANIQVNSSHAAMNGVSNPMVNGFDSLYGREELSLNSHDDDLGFDPWHESSKGLADLLLKEADEKAKANGYINSTHSTVGRRPPVPNEHTAANSLFYSNPAMQQQNGPPPGFPINSYGANCATRNAFRDVFSNKTLPVMNMYNHQSSSNTPSMSFQQHSGNGALNNLYMRDAGMRPQQTNEWQESLVNLQKKNPEFSNFGLQSHRLPSQMGRFPSSAMWNNTVQTEMSWPQQEQNFESRNVGSSQIEKMLQALKFNEQMSKLQSKYNSSYPIFRGGNS